MFSSDGFLLLSHDPDFGHGLEDFEDISGSEEAGFVDGEEGCESNEGQHKGLRQSSSRERR